MKPQARTIERVFMCTICNEEYSNKEAADTCIEKHLVALQKVLPKYEIGGHVITHLFNDISYGKERASIVGIIGEFFDMKLLVENDKGERYHVNAIRYQTLNLKHNPADFKVLQLV